MTTTDQSIAQTEQALRQEGRQRMAGATITFLKKHAPFNKMTADALQDFAQKAQIAFYPAGSTIVGTDSGNVRFFYLIESGKVQARQAGEVTVTEYSILSLSAGECFPIGAVTAGRPSTNNYTAVEDTFCYKLPAEDFMVLMTTSPEFHPLLHPVHRQPAQSVTPTVAAAIRPTRQRPTNTQLAALRYRFALASEHFAGNTRAFGTGNHVASQSWLPGSSWRRQKTGRRIHPFRPA